MPKHPQPGRNQVRALLYFFQDYLADLHERDTLPNPERVELLIREANQLLLALIPDDDEDTPGLRR